MYYNDNNILKSIKCLQVITIKYVFKFMKKYRIQAALGPLFKLFEALLELYVPIVVAKIIDDGIKGQSSSIILFNTGFLVILAAIGLAFSVTAQYFSAKAAVGCASKMRASLFDKLQSFSFSQIDKIGTSAMITRMTSDINQVQTGINLTLRLLLRSPFVVFGAMTMAFTVNVKSALVFVVVIPVLFIVILGIMLLTVPMYRKIQARLDGIIGITRENLRGVRVIRAFRREAAENAEFDGKNSALARFQKSVGVISAFMNPATYVIINIGIVVMLNNGAIMIDSGELTSGQLIALYNFMSQILVELVKLASLIITVTKSLASLSRVSDVFNMDIDALNKSNGNFKNDGSIVFDNVSLCYNDSGEKSLEGISFSVKSGEKIGIIGGTGSGKTSVVNLIPAFYKATCGTVSVGGYDVNEWNDNDLRASIGIVPQKAVLFNGTIRANLKWGNSDATDEQIMDAIKIAQAADVIESKQGGLDEIIEQEGKNLSGGQLQRLTIARALVRNPKILILDDSASALDYATDANLRKDINKLTDMTVIIVSQRASSLLGCDKILVLDDGKQVGFGTHYELIKSCDIYREIYYTQFEKETDDE